MKMVDILLEAKWDNIKSQMKQYFIDCSKKYFREYYGKYPIPDFVVKMHGTRAGWFAGRYSKEYPDGGIIGINPDFLQNETDFKGIIYHETIHYYQFCTYSQLRYKIAPNGGHDDFFIDMMKRINSGEGTELVTIKQETSHIKKSATGSFWAYGIKTKNGEYGFVHTKKRNDKIIDNLKKLYASGKYADVFAFETDEYKFKIGKVTDRGFKFAVPTEQNIGDLGKYSVSKL